MVDEQQPEESSSEFDQILVEYFRQIDAGEEIDKEQFLAQHPEHAEALAEFLSAEAQFRPKSGGSGPQDTPTLLTGRAGSGLEKTLPVVRYFGDYELLEEIARGGMGVVYKARQTSLNRIVAVKMILSGQLARESDVQRFRAEAEAAAKLQHPHIVQIYEVGEQNGQHYFSMEYIEGVNLAEMVRDYPLPAQEASQIVSKVASAIEYAHQQGVLHRDLKPSNVLIDARGEVKVTDFGLAKLLEGDQQLTQTDQILGTPSYMPPEQAQGNQALMGPTSDVYSLGAVLYHLLTGRPPFAAATQVETIHQVIHHEAVSPRLLEKSLPKDLETICQKCLEKEPHRRYARAEQLADDLQRFLENRPIVARPISRPARMWRWCRRRPLVASLSTAFVLALVVGTTISTYYAYVADKNAVKERVARREATKQRKEAERQRAVADENFERAFETVDKFLTRVSEDELLNQPSLQPLRKDLLELALNYYQKFAEQKSDDPLVLAELASAHERVGRINGLIGSRQDAIEATQEAITIREALVEKVPGNQSIREQLANSYTSLGQYFQAVGEFATAEDSFRTAIELADQIVDVESNVPSYQATLANAIAANAKLFREIGRWDDMIRALAQQLAIFEELAEHDPDYQLQLANAHYDLALGLHQRHEDMDQVSAWTLQYTSRLRKLRPTLLSARKQSSKTHIEAAVTLLREINKQTPVPEVAHDLAKALMLFGTLRPGSDGNEALTKYEEVQDILERLSLANPRVPDYKFSLAKCLREASRRYIVLKRTADYESSSNGARQILQDLTSRHPDRVDYAVEFAKLTEQDALDLLKTESIDSRIRLQVRATELYARAIDLHPDTIVNRIELSHAYRTLGNLNLKVGSSIEAEKCYQEGVDVLATIAEEYPKVNSLQYHLSLAERLLGHYRVRSGQLDAAGRLYQSAALRMEQLLQVSGNAAYENLLDLSYERMELLSLASGHASEALEWRMKRLKATERSFVRTDFNCLELADLYLETVKDFRDILEKKERLSLITKAHQFSSYALLMGPTSTAFDMRAKAHFLLGRFAEMQQDRKDALNHFSRPEHFLDYFQLAVKQHGAGELERALANCTEAIDLLETQSLGISGFPGSTILLNGSQRFVHTSAYLYRGEIQKQRGEVVEAESDFREAIKVIETEPEKRRSPLEWKLLGKAYYRLGAWEEARKAFERNIQYKNDQSPTIQGGARWWWLAMVLRQQGETTRAREIYDILIRQFASNPQIGQLETIREAEDVLEISADKRYRVEPSDSDYSREQEGNELVEFVLETIKAKKSLSERKPDVLKHRYQCAWQYAYLADSYSRVEQHTEAISAQKEMIKLISELKKEHSAVALDVSLAEGYERLATVCLRAGQEAEADKARDSLLKLAEQYDEESLPTSAFWGIVGRQCVKLNKWVQARKSFEVVFTLRKETEPSLNGDPRWFYYALSLDRLGEPERALAIFSQLDAAIANDPTRYSSVAVRNEVAEALGIEDSRQDESFDEEGSKPLQAEKPEAVDLKTQ